jgi:hypothetical protein
MKFNLKNFPKKVLAYTEYIWWKEGFEAELREMKKKWEIVKNAEILVEPQHIINDLKELLGENEGQG